MLEDYKSSIYFVIKEKTENVYLKWQNWGDLILFCTAFFSYLVHEQPSIALLLNFKFYLLVNSKLYKGLKDKQDILGHEGLGFIF